MGNVEKASWEVYLEGDCVGKETPGGLRVYQVVVRITGGGIQGIVKARKNEDYFVVFVGAGTLSSLAAKVRNVVGGDDTKWHLDAYPPT